MAEESSGGGGNDFGFFITFFVGLFILWMLAGGGEEGGLLGDRSTTTETARVSTERGQQYVSVPQQDPEPPTRREVERDLREAHNELEDLEEEVRTAKIWGVHSPFEGQVRLSRSQARSENPDTEYLTIDVVRGDGAPVDISGWLIESYVTERGETIPFGTRVPRVGRVNTTEPILLYPGERAYITTGESPIGVSFRENMCTGYLSQFQDFYPSLSRSCPRPIDEMERFGSIDLDNDNCYDYVERLPSCRIVLDEAEDEDISRSCKNFVVRELTYTGCVENHRYDIDFDRGVWRIYLGLDVDDDEDEDEPDDLWRSEREIIKLMDRSGKTVDVLEY